MINKFDKNDETAKAVYDPDSSPKAWGEYINWYKGSKISEIYDFDKLCLYNWYKDVDLNSGYCHDGRWFNYVNKESESKYNRLFALKKGTQSVKDWKGDEYFEAASRVGGECDFNFNDTKCSLFEKIIGDKNVAAMQQLNRCKKKHHSPLNFSLMESMGNLQECKGCNRYDRPDTFVWQLSLYYRGMSSDILKHSHGENRKALIEYLNAYDDVYDYCKEVYFIDRPLVDKIVEQGQLPIDNCDDLMRYMCLAEEFWAKKSESLNKLLDKCKSE